MMMVAHKEYERKRDQMRFAYKSLVVAALSSSKRNNTPITDRAGRKRFLTGWSTKYTTTPYLAHGLNDVCKGCY